MNSSHTMTGVYAIRHIASGKRYVGSAAVSFRRRWATHLACLRRGTHHSCHLQSAWSKHGEAAFSFDVVETCLPCHAVAVEQVMIDFYKSASREYGYNIAPMAGSNRGLSRNNGRKASDEVRAKMSAAQRGRKHSEETRKKMSKSMTGLKRSADCCEQMSQRNKGKAISEETKAKISAANKGLRRSDETRMRMSQAARLRTPIKHSQKSRDLMSEAHRGKPKTEQHKAAMALGKIKAKMRRVSSLLSILPPLGF